MADNRSQGPPPGPPYAPQTAVIGGIPSIAVDVPIISVFMVIYLCFAAVNMALFKKNLKQQHKFPISVILFVFSMARLITCMMRIVWATHQRDVPVAIAAQIFNNAGVLIVYLINLVFAQRILRSIHPKLGWNTALSHAFHALYAVLVGTLIMVITATVIMFYTFDPYTRQACASCQRAATTILFVLTTIPLLLMILSFLLPHSKASEDSFGSGSIKLKALVLTLTTCIAMTLSGFKLGTAWETPRPLSDPAWYHSKAAFYCFGYMLEILVLCVFILGRVDQRFYVPDGSSKRKNYTSTEQLPAEQSSVEHLAAREEKRLNSGRESESA